MAEQPSAVKLTFIAPTISYSTMTQGYLYTAFGERYVSEARISAASLKSVSKCAQVCLITDQPIAPGGEFDIVLPITSGASDEHYAKLDRGAYYRKIDQFVRSPFDQTIYLDSDTYISCPLEGLFTLLDRYELLVTLDGNAEVNYAFEQTVAPFSSIPKEFGCFNTGVLAYRKSPRTHAFFQQWSSHHQNLASQHTVNDQPAFRLTLFESDIRYHTLPVIFNWFSWIPFYIPSGGSVAIMHGRNPWLFRWAKHFKAPTSIIVGPISLKHQFIYYAARLLHWLSRRKIIRQPRL